LTVQVDARNGVASVALRGELDLATVPILLQQMGRLHTDGVSDIMLDLRDLTFVGSTGAHAFADAREEARSRGKRLIVIGASEPVRRVLELLRLGSLLDDERSSRLMERFTSDAPSVAAAPPPVAEDGRHD
jgi:anti-sigma B factor antagonist